MSDLPAPLPLIDTHAHLDFERFAPDFDEILARARRAGVEQIVTIGAGGDFAANHRALAIARAHPHITATLGIHPHEAHIAEDDLFEQIAELARRDANVVAIGETGLDYHYDRSPREVQRHAFARFVGVARAVGQPVVVHTREAEEDTIAILESEGAAECGGIIHCFSGTAHLAERALALGFYLSFSGIMTFPNAHEVRDVARWVPAGRVLVETDAPYLAPIPVRGQRNEPAFVNHTLRCLAELRGDDPGQLAQRTSDNARRLFGLPNDGLQPPT